MLNSTRDFSHSRKLRRIKRRLDLSRSPVYFQSSAHRFLRGWGKIINPPSLSRMTCACVCVCVLSEKTISHPLHNDRFNCIAHGGARAGWKRYFVCSIFPRVACNRPPPPAILYLQHCHHDAVAPIPRDLSAYIDGKKVCRSRRSRKRKDNRRAATCRDNGDTGSKGNYYSLGLKDPTASCGGNCAPANALHFCANLPRRERRVSVSTRASSRRLQGSSRTWHTFRSFESTRISPGDELVEIKGGLFDARATRTWHLSITGFSLWHGMFTRNRQYSSCKEKIDVMRHYERMLHV